MHVILLTREAYFIWSILTLLPKKNVQNLDNIQQVLSLTVRYADEANSKITKNQNVCTESSCQYLGSVWKILFGVCVGLFQNMNILIVV